MTPKAPKTGIDVDALRRVIPDLLKSIDLSDLLKSTKDQAGSLAMLVVLEATGRFGSDGLEQAKKILETGKCPDWASARLDSEWLAFMQNAHADGLEQSRAALAKIQDTAFQISIEILKALLLAAI